MIDVRASIRLAGRQAGTFASGLVAALCGALSLPAQAADDPATASVKVYDFQVLLDDRPIGVHRFTIATDGAEHHVTSDARFAVKVLGFEAYRYRHHAEEQWNGDCLATLASNTDDDGKPSSVKLRRSGDIDEVVTGSGTTSVSGCLMSYAYWDPALRSQTRLLNPQTGRVDAVKIERLGTGLMNVHGERILAVDWRITGGEAPVDVWISEGGDWVGLDSLVAKGRHKLSYRLNGHEGSPRALGRGSER